ncbi:hypothetical protein B0J17DRAFT_683561 [Rhizoctonia solani]|nr:hypothetical protein B0J17DRAFT_683561 [Rhizoctonia solani]
MSFWAGSSASSGNPSLAWSMGNGGQGYILIKFPLPLNNSWYSEQPCTTFRTFEHRKERGVFGHEFIVLRLLDGSFCRIERMGDPNARFDALSPRGSLAHDMAQCFGPEDVDQPWLKATDIIAEITLPADFDLMDVLVICCAIHEGEKSRKFTQVYNCYFFALAIQACLTRLAVHWEYEVPLRIWLSEINKGIWALPDTLHHVLFGIHSLLVASDDCPSNKKPLIEEIKHKLSHRITEDTKRITKDVADLIGSTLWHPTIGSALDQFIKDSIREAIVGIFIDGFTESQSSLGPSQPPTRQDLMNQALLILVELLAAAEHMPNNSDPNTAQEISTTDINKIKWYRFGLWLIDCSLGTTNAPLFAPVMDMIPCTVIDVRLERLAHLLEGIGAPTCGDLEHFIKEIRSLIGNKAAVWGTDPFEELSSRIQQHVPDSILKDIGSDEPAIGFCCKEFEHEARQVGIGIFQRHLLGRIGRQALSVERAWLGSATLIKAELEDTLSNVWKLVCKQNSMTEEVAQARQETHYQQSENGWEQKRMSKTHQTELQWEQPSIVQEQQEILYDLTVQDNEREWEQSKCDREEHEPSSSLLQSPQPLLLDSNALSGPAPKPPSRPIKKVFSRVVTKFRKPFRDHHGCTPNYEPSTEQATEVCPTAVCSTGVATTTVTIATNLVSFITPQVPISGLNTLGSDVQAIMRLTQMSKREELIKFGTHVDRLISSVARTLQNKQITQQAHIRECLETFQRDVNQISREISRMYGSKDTASRLRRALISDGECVYQMRQQLDDAFRAFQFDVDCEQLAVLARSLYLNLPITCLETADKYVQEANLHNPADSIINPESAEISIAFLNVENCRRSIQHNPGPTQTLKLAAALRHLSDLLASDGQSEEAFAASKESGELYQALATRE